MKHRNRPASSRTRLERIARRITAGLVAAAVAAVAVSGLPAFATARVHTLPAKNIDDWTMPLDRYIAVGVSDYAEALLERPCMEKAGYSWDVPWRDVDAMRRHTAHEMGTAVRYPLSLTEAQKTGYHKPPPNDPSAAAWKAFAYRDISEKEHDVLYSCVDVIRESLPTLSGRQQQASLVASRLKKAAFQAAVHDGNVLEAASRWRTCMSAADIPDLPQTPAEMPSSSLKTRFHLNAPQSTPGHHEVDLAVMDVRCRESSGYRGALYQAEWERQVTIPQKDALILNHADGITEHNREVLAAIRANIPKKP